MLAGGEKEIRGNMMKTKDVIVHIPHRRPLGLLFHIVQFEMQLQATVPIEQQMGILSFNGEAAASSAVFRIYPEVPFQNKRHHCAK